MKNNTVVSIINSGSCFRGLIGTVTRLTGKGLVEVTFTKPFHGHKSALFFEHELAEV